MLVSQLENILYIFAALLIISFIVTIHELGHFIVGRLCGIGVVEFSVGMGPRLLGFKRKGIEYSLRMIPLGGYCKFVGEDEENKDPTAMNNQPVWKRFVTVIAGVTMNFILAYLAAVILFAGYSGKIVPRLAEVTPDAPAAVAGLREGDLIVGVNGLEVAGEAGVMRVQSEVAAAEDQPVALEGERDGERLSFEIKPELITLEDGTSRYLIGIVFGSERYSLLESLPAAFNYMRESSGMLLDALRKLVFKGEGAKDMAGTVGIVSIMSENVRQGWYMVFYFLFVISLNLGIMNLLPLPALDGGRLVFLIVEAVRGKPVPPEKEGLVHGIGMLLFIALFVFVTYNDIARLIHG